MHQANVHTRTRTHTHAHTLPLPPRYATTAVTMNALKAIAAKNNIPIQELVVRNDSPCGSTIGPMSSANTGIRTVGV